MSGDKIYRLHSATDLLLKELALSSTHPENTDAGGGSNPDKKVMSQTKKQTFFQTFYLDTDTLDKH